MTLEQTGYNIVRKAIHDKAFSRRDVRRLLRAFLNTYPASHRSRLLQAKFLWHRLVCRFNADGKDAPEIGGELLKTTTVADRKTNNVLLVSHEMSNTGAPRALLSLAMQLRKNGYRPVILTYLGGPLISEAQENGIEVTMSEVCMKEASFASPENSLMAGFLASFPAVIVNTLVAMDKFPTMFRRFTADKKARLYGWIHEAECIYTGFGIDGKHLEDMVAEFDDIWIVGEHARSHALRRTPRAMEFRNFYYLVPEIKSMPIKQEGKKERRLKLLLAGSLEPQKGHLILLQALRNLADNERMAFEIHLMGHAYDEAIAAAVREYPGKELIYHGAVPHDELIRQLAEMDAVICPSLDDCMPIICTEAFQLNVPVMVSDHTGTAAFIEDGKNGFVVKGGEADSLSSGLRRLLMAKDRLPEMGRAGHRIYVENFSEEAFNRQIQRYFPPVT